VGLVTIFYCLRFETSYFVVSYDLQGYGGGIRPRLYTGESSLPAFFSLYNEYLIQHGPYRKHRAQQVLYCCVFTEPLLSNDRVDTETHRQEGDLIRLLLFIYFQNKESRLIN
jgi:hypothetical protein